MSSTQFERDQRYLAALSIFRDLHRSGVVSESELGEIASFLADRFSASVVARTLGIA